MNHQTDQTKLKGLQSRIRARKGLIGCGREFSAALHTCGKLVYAGTDRWGQEEARRWSAIGSVVCGQDHIVALTEDGSLHVAGRCPVGRDFTDMLSCVRAVSVGEAHMAALLSNGRTVVGGDDRYRQCNTSDWPTVTDVVCGKSFTAGLTESGQVVITGGSRPLRHIVRAWRQVAGIFTDFTGKDMYAITAEGKILSTAHLPGSVAEWKNLVYMAGNSQHLWAVTGTGQLLSTDPAVSHMNSSKYFVSCAVSDTHVIALTRDGQVLSVGQNDFGQCNTPRFGALFTGFEEFSADRQAKNIRAETAERVYQVHLVEALRYGKRIACGERITACISADGRVLTSAGFQQSRNWSQVRAIACGNAHLLALHENGSVSADGNDVDGCTAVSAWENIKSVAAGKYHSLGLTEDGHVLFCGRNDKGQGDVSDWRGIRRIYASDDYTVGVTFEGRVLVAGTPPFAAGSINEAWLDPTDIAVTPTHMAALYANGRVLSTLTVPASAKPDDGDVCDTVGWQNVRAIAAGRNFTVGLCFGGRVLAVGRNDCGQCNTADWEHVVDVGCGNAYTVGLTAGGRVLATGHQKNKDADFPDPPETHRWQDIMALQCGPDHTVALTRGGQVLSCGLDEDKQCSATTHFTLFRDVRQLYGYGQYGRQLEMEIQANRTAVSEPVLSRFVEALSFPSLADAARALHGSFAVGMAHTVQLDGEAHIITDGANDCGQCDIASYEAAVQVAAGPYRSAAILPDGHIVLAGRNTDGQGDARTLNRELDTPDAASAHMWRWVSCGYAHTVALRSDGRVFAIGANPDGRCDTRQWRDVTHIACGVRHTVAIRADGTCVAVGDNRYGQCDVSSWEHITMVAAGEFHTVALRADGRVEAVGDDRKGQCNVDDLRDVISVACLPEATLCVCADGGVVIRGGSGELDPAVEALRDVVAMDTCEHRIAVMTAERELIMIP